MEIDMNYGNSTAMDDAMWQKQQAEKRIFSEAAMQASGVITGGRGLSLGGEMPKAISEVEREIRRCMSANGELAGAISVLTERLDGLIAPRPETAGNAQNTIGCGSAVGNRLREIGDQTAGAVRRIQSLIDGLAL